MLYILLCSVVLLIVVIGTVIRATTSLMSPESAEQTQHASPGVGQRLKQMGLVFTSYAVGLAYCAPLIYLMFGSYEDPGKTFGVDDARFSVYLVLAGSAALLFYLPYLWRRAADTKRFWPMGQLLLIALACFVGVKSAYDHLTFFSTSQAGWANVSFLRDAEKITDMPTCTSEIAFVRFQSTGPFEYRCPGVVVFNRFSSQPFAPWPHNDSGVSQQLADAILKIKSKAGAPADFADNPAPQ